MIEFVDALPASAPGLRPSVWRDRLAPLVNHPNRWAIVLRVAQRNVAAAHVSNLRRRRPLGLDGRWEFTSRLLDGGAVVLARYLGPEEAS